MSQYKLIIFDFDGTLAITHKAIISCITKTFESFGNTPPEADIIQGTIGINLQNTFKMLHPAIEESAIPEWVETYRSYYRTEGEKQLDLFPGTKQILQLASKSGLSLIVFSNKHLSFVNLFLEKLRINGFFDLILGDDGQIIQKPNPSVFHSIIKPLFPDLDNSQVLMVGDTAVDLLFAKNAGIDVCWAAYGYGDRAECLALAPTFAIDDISELAAIVQN
ncbi:MAG: HAD family hydrolase [Microcoleus sp. PH2017_01_SCD_O_A]|uniref:HAD family hydrolase n=1 Tax=unclassified Microcoleus TaxID=2642155 RepID=UPI001D632062|nr:MULTISPECIES: HAD family hydrolase [unclassified Microcoleus]MCC3422652.1 HAD family hydrolase [Microcoleus sp. PH2017_01_SCD_O_A]MCC3564259.1 HAD family hydrolase [Microcoleus sp. PH2017_31_RDM_U_A]MCC3576716.1 HAD family hydrolase [Microcoleus sp. PH2017_32_RDM_D_A]MCC3614651.1 HAD family hydrolase [Microcoleus sp. PH2017_38_RDM_U_B]MCC3627729.1 HAD family hydrolase [Microcoleus sp. PH2017_39_LGB_O_B]